MDIFLPSVDQKRKLFHYQDLNQIILEKDSIVQGLQDEVGSVPSTSPCLCPPPGGGADWEGGSGSGRLPSQGSPDRRPVLSSGRAQQPHCASGLSSKQNSVCSGSTKKKLFKELCHQDTLSKAREVALRILQNTVYQMVEQIPQVPLSQLISLKYFQALYFFAMKNMFHFTLICWIAF